MQLIDETNKGIKEVDESSVKTLIPLTINIKYIDGSYSGPVTTFVDSNMSASMALRKKITESNFLTVTIAKDGKNEVSLCNTNMVQKIILVGA